MRETATIVLLTVLYLGSVAASPCADQTQRGLDACAGAARDKADAALNGAYKQIVARLADDPGKTKRLIEAEKAWIAFRDAECAFANSDTEGGSIHSMEVTLCEEKLTNIRAQQLRSYLKCGEGDMESRAREIEVPVDPGEFTARWFDRPGRLDPRGLASDPTAG
jgi:uncharacterized protein YecT (DUF1311 family)